MDRIDLDANATVPVRPDLWEAMRAAPSGNPSSAHAAGRKARQALDAARETVARMLGAFPDEVIFTGGATEANNLAVFGLAGETPGHLITSRLEHPCVTGPVEELAKRGWAVDWLPVSGRGLVSANDVTDRIRLETKLVAVMLANHETGAVQPVAEVTRILPSGIVLHCDAAQAAGKIPVDFHALGVTTLSVSAHKFGGPVGVGALLVKRGTNLRPRTFGGHQQRGLRPGTEPVALAVGMAKALETTAVRTRLETTRARLFDRLEQAAPVVLNGPEIGAADVVPTTLNVSFPGCRADVLLMALDLAGVSCSTGSACSSGSLLPSPVLKAMGVRDDVLRSAIRFSFTTDRTDDEIDEAARRITACVKQVRTAAGPLPSPV
jgi:cysteine desulfurase